MVRNTSLFCQLLSLFPRYGFEILVLEHGANRGAKGFDCWTQFVSLLFCQLAQTKSLREICYGLRSCLGKLVHLGVKKTPPRSTLAYANEHRPWQLYRDLFYQTLQHCRKNAPKNKFRFRNKLLSMDATIIELCLSLFHWAKFNRLKGAVKLHMLLDHDGYFPVFAHITEGRAHEVKIAGRFEFPSDSVIAMDKGFMDATLLLRWTKASIWFVIPQKKNLLYQVLESRPLPKHRNILADEVISFTSPYLLQRYPLPLRRVVIWDPEHERKIVLLTNQLSFGATTIAAIYKDRWQIELFFKALKQNLKIKTFIGTSPNAVKTQIWTALIAMLLIKYLQFRSRIKWSLSNLITLLRLNLFTYRDLELWLQNPFDTPPQTPLPQQMVLHLDSIRS
jgi:hypothetical protein